MSAYLPYNVSIASLRGQAHATSDGDGSVRIQVDVVSDRYLEYDTVCRYLAGQLNDLGFWAMPENAPVSSPDQTPRVPRHYDCTCGRTFTKQYALAGHISRFSQLGLWNIHHKADQDPAR